MNSTRSFILLHAICIVVVLIPHTLLAQEDKNSKFRFERKYKPHDQYQYRLTCEEYQNGKWSSTAISVCNLLVSYDSTGIPFDEVHWISTKRKSPKDSADLTAIALRVKPYAISLHPRGSQALPRIEEAEMTEPITDFHTFLVAVAPSVGVQNLKKVNDSFTLPKTVTGDFSNGKNIIKGQDCFKVTVALTKETKRYAWLRTSFIPPQNPCFPYLTSDINIPVVADTMNNFQMVMPAGEKKFSVQFGREYFYINSMLRKRDGKIKNADMYNRLTLKLKLNCDSNYQDCQMDLPFSIERKLKLELL